MTVTLDSIELTQWENFKDGKANLPTNHPMFEWQKTIQKHQFNQVMHDMKKHKNKLERELAAHQMAEDLFK